MNFKAIFTFTLLFIAGFAISQNCASWNELPNKDELEGEHSVYRSHVKAEEYETAFKHWEKVYEVAPVADGQRDFHFTDGIKIYKHKLKSAAEADKAAIKAKIIELYDGCIACYEAGKIAFKGGDEAIKQRVGYLKGQKAYDMYYELNSNYSANLEELDQAVAITGDETMYNVLIPYATIATYQFQKEKIDKEKARSIFDNIVGIAERKIEEGGKYAAYYENALANINSEKLKIERDIYDCEYFKAKLRPQYDANPDDPQLAKELYGQLIRRGCDKTDPLVQELEKKYEKWATQVNAQKKAEFEANNPALLAKRAYDSGDYQGAINKYNEAINGEADPAKKASYHFYIASTLFRKMKKYGEARTEARKAISSNPNYGRAIMLIGDMYATTARSCGDSWNQRLAVLAASEKYRRAASLDPTVADEANDKISKYRSSMPNKEEGFLRGVKAGSKQKVGCWIGETVTVRY